MITPCHLPHSLASTMQPPQLATHPHSTLTALNIADHAQPPTPTFHCFPYAIATSAHMINKVSWRCRTKPTICSEFHRGKSCLFCLANLDSNHLCKIVMGSFPLKMLAR